MVKSDLIENIAGRAGITLTKAEHAIDLFFGLIQTQLCNGGRVEIRGFGALSVKEYKGYTGRNPKLAMMSKFYQNACLSGEQEQS